jgi:hypothetical protein
VLERTWFQFLIHLKYDFLGFKNLLFNFNVLYCYIAVCAALNRRDALRGGAVRQVESS